MLTPTVTPTSGSKAKETYHFDTTSVRSSQGSARFNASTHLIPSPGSEGKPTKRFDPLIMSLPLVIGVPILMLILGIGLETALWLSHKNGGFKVPPRNVFETFSTQFLLSFFPTLLIIPVAFLWREMDWMLRYYQPYMVLLRGRATAEESLLLDYTMLGPFLAIFRALKYKHTIILWSSLTVLGTYLFQPLAGSIFQIRQAQQSTDGSVTSIRTLDLNPDFLDLTAFVAAAGFAEAAVFNSLPDPPFIKGGWAAAEFVFPTSPGLGGSMSVETTAVQTTANCSNSVGPAKITPIQGSTQLNMTGVSVDGCAHSVIFDPAASSQQYGVDSVPCPGDAATEDVIFRPIMFWYYSNQWNGGTQARAVFCAPSIDAFTVKANADLGNGSLTSVTILSQYTQPNNVTGGVLGGKALNAVIFDNNTDPFIQARAIATRSGIPGAVFRFASQLPGGPLSTFNEDNGFLSITNKVYTQHLSISAKSVYFINSNDTLPATVVAYVPRLIVDAFPAHMLSIFLILIGFAGLIMQVINRRNRKKLLLAAPPGSIAAVVALTSRSGFGSLLLPYDDEATLERKLDGLRFRLDDRTGAILAEDHTIESFNMRGSYDSRRSLLPRAYEP